jgi:S-adenosylmethionine:tRNA ribosyltransferase-isomerase
VQIDELRYDLPPHLIAQQPLARRDQARMLVLDRNSKTPHRHDHARIADLPGYLRPGDCLVINDTQVLPARFTGRRSTGGRVEGLYISTPAPDLWRVLLRPSGRLRPGQALELDGADARLHLVRRLGGGEWEIRIEPVQSAMEILERIGWTPLPPYIKRAYAGAAGRRTDAEDRRRYQTVYARRPGAVAAPTAGLHLTEALLDALKTGGVAIAPVTLHVGLGTFEPIKCDRLEDHLMHAEWYDLPEVSAGTISSARAAGGRVVAVGTTSARVLETCTGTGDLPRPGRGMTDLFIYPPYRFRAVDVLLTNFHLPGSTLLALVFAFAGRDRVLEAYRRAIELGYRFYSFGDAMLIL